MATPPVSDTVSVPTSRSSILDGGRSGAEQKEGDAEGIAASSSGGKGSFASSGQKRRRTSRDAGQSAGDVVSPPAAAATIAAAAAASCVSTTAVHVHVAAPPSQANAAAAPAATCPTSCQPASTKPPPVPHPRPPYQYQPYQYPPYQCPPYPYGHPIHNQLKNMIESLQKENVQLKELRGIIAKRDALKVEMSNLRDEKAKMKAWCDNEKAKMCVRMKAKYDDEKAKYDDRMAKMKAKYNDEYTKMTLMKIKYDDEKANMCVRMKAKYDEEKAKYDDRMAKMKAKYDDEKAKYDDRMAKMKAKYDDEKAKYDDRMAKMKAKYDDEKAKYDDRMAKMKIKYNDEYTKMKADIEKERGIFQELKDQSRSHPSYGSEGQIIRPLRYVSVPGRMSKYDWPAMILSQDFIQKMNRNSEKLGITSQDCANDCIARLADKLPATKAKLEDSIKSKGLDPILHPLQLGASTGATKPEDVKQVIVGNYFASSDLTCACASDGSLFVDGITFLKQIEDVQACLSETLYGVPDKEYRLQFRAKTALFDTHSICFPTDASKNHDSQVNMRVLLEATEASQREIITNALNNMPNANLLLALGSIAAPTAHMVRAKCTRGEKIDVCPSYHCHYSASTERAGSQNRDGGIERERMEESAQSIAAGVAAVLGKPLVKAPDNDPDFWFNNYLEMYPQTRNDTSLSSPKQYYWKTAAEAGENDPRLANWMVKKTASAVLYRKDGLTLPRPKACEYEVHGINGSTGSRSVYYWKR